MKIKVYKCDICNREVAYFNVTRITVQCPEEGKAKFRRVKKDICNLCIDTIIFRIKADTKEIAKNNTMKSIL